MSKKFTVAQQQAIDCDDANILVSAAAGSGKTAVLTERILRHVKSGVDIDNLLVVTFTEPASAEMRERITEGLQNAELYEQLFRLPVAQISTIHAFCSKLVREFFQVVDIDPTFRVADAAEVEVIRRQVMEELFESEYAQESNEAFVDLADVYGGKSTDGRLDVLVRKIYDFMESAPFPSVKANEYSQLFETCDQLDTTPWVAIVLDELSLGLDGAIEGIKQAIKICRMYGGPGKYEDKFEDELEMLNNLQDLVSSGVVKSMRSGLDGVTPENAKRAFSGALVTRGKTDFKLFHYIPTFESLYNAFCSIDWGKLPSITKKDVDVDPDLKKRAQDIRNKAVKERITKLAKGVFFAPPHKMLSDLGKIAPRVGALMNLVQKFSHAFSAEKRAQNVLDFSDLEHFAIKILYPNAPEDMQPSDVIKFHEVLVDEFQDSNEVQDLILSAVAHRRFMVGDVKQSIYRFRRADPGIFMAKYKQYADGIAGTRIDLSHNFRSKPEVLDTVNFFFSQLMCEKVGEVEYDKSAALYPGHSLDSYPKFSGFCDNFDTMGASPSKFEAKHPDIKMNVEILDQADDSVDFDNDDEDAFENDQDRDDETPSNIVAETRVIAKKINEILTTFKVWDSGKNDFRKCKLNDIAIITRGLAGVSGAVVEELKVHGIDAIADTNAGFLDQKEVKTALAFLKIIDNPRQDIELLTVLFSPIYALTADELLLVRNYPVRAKDSDIGSKIEPVFFDHVCTFVEDILGMVQDNEIFPSGTMHNNTGTALSACTKLEKFLQDFTTWRELSLYYPISRMLGLIYNDTKYPAHVLTLPGGVIRQANLRILIELAIKFESTGNTSLFRFLTYMERLYSSDANISGAMAENSTGEIDRVRIMSIHKSKGLEFPVVICAFMGKIFNTDDARQPVVLHPGLGVGPYYVDTHLRTRANTLPRYSLSQLVRRENLSEELRCLYVALTRAKDLIVLTARCKDLAKSIEKWATVIGTDTVVLPTYYRSGAKSYLDWIMPCLLRHRSAANLVTHIDFAKKTDVFDHAANFEITVHKMIAITQEGSMVDNIIPPEHEVLDEVNSFDIIDSPQAFQILEPYDKDLIGKAVPSKLSISEIKRIHDAVVSPGSFFRARSITTDGGDTLAMSSMITKLNFDPPKFLSQKDGYTPAEIGTIMHLVVEHLDYSTCFTLQDVESLVARLLQMKLLLPEEASAISFPKIVELINSPLATRIRNATAVYKEMPFVLKLPASELPSIYDDMGDAGDEEVIIHGIIDCYFEEDGELVVVDYKSDAYPEGHVTQLKIYKRAVESATGLNVKDVILYSFAIGECRLDVT